MDNPSKQYVNSSFLPQQSRIYVCQRLQMCYLLQMQCLVIAESMEQNVAADVEDLVRDTSRNFITTLC